MKMFKLLGPKLKTDSFKKSNKIQVCPSRKYMTPLLEHGTGGGDVESIPPFSYVRSAMTRARQELVPNIPWEVDDVEIEGTWAETWLGDYFLLHQDNDWGIFLFVTPENLEGLSRCTDVYMDGTFRTCPRRYSQFFTVHGKYRNRVILFVSCLVTGKNIGQYQQISHLPCGMFSRGTWTSKCLNICGK
jgi:hypothetical protein